MRYIERHPDRVLLVNDHLMLHGRDFLNATGEIDFEPLPTYRRQEAFRVIPRGASDRALLGPLLDADTATFVLDVQ